MRSKDPIWRGQMPFSIHSVESVTANTDEELIMKQL